MKEINVFQTVVLIIFGLFVAAAMLIFSGVLPGVNRGDRNVGGTVVIWGTIPEKAMRDAIEMVERSNEKSFNIVYAEKTKESFDNELTEALAGGEGPDIIVLPQDLIYKHKNKIKPIPYQSLPLRSFYDTFISEGKLYLDKEGILGLPLFVDPLVMYYNRDIWSNAGIAEVPKVWGGFIDNSKGKTVIEKLTAQDERNNVIQSAISLGDYGNISHAKDIMAVLIMQSGNFLTALDEKGKLRSVISESGSSAVKPAVAAVNFFLQFSNPARVTYTWNSSFQNSKNAFPAGVLAAYIGYASELAEIRNSNPHLNFDASVLPQRDNKRMVTFGRMTALSVMKQSKNQATALKAVSALTQAAPSKSIAQKLSLPSARKDVLAEAVSDPVMTVFVQSALISGGWIDPAPQATDEIIGTMVQSSAIGRTGTSEAVERAGLSMDRLLQ